MAVLTVPNAWSKEDVADFMERQVLSGAEERKSLVIDKIEPCVHDHLDMDGICRKCGADCRGI